ncbi:TonB-dependent receptor domain-containing protein [Halomonas sp. PAR7]|uniref:TonB-dependent receptor domain-containing protein n=1 Tax=Halomonas sp. PAR7 TaxID=3075514 RepID=UPI0028882360|nr:TonB-dependent receptor [Halomonas sp. PAR7]MDT0502145.1 TonB-dependent receptor [Halomonas sp. PAR7]
MNTTHATRGLATFALAALPLAVQAADAQTADTGETQVLNPMVVTAALAPRTADESLASVTLLDEATLRRQDPTSLTDLFRGQPGVDVTSSGSFGKSSSVYIRGTSSNQSLLMIDGIRLRSATTGAPAWEFLDPRMFDRAEIVRGPRGSLYGADAMGGVIQLFTPEGEEGGATPRISFGGGSFDTQRYSASLSGAEGGTRYHFAASRFDTEGAPVRRGGEDMGYDNTTALARMSHTFDSGAELGLLALRARGTTEYDESGSLATTDFVQQVAGVYAELPVSDNWRSRLTLSEARDESDNHFYDSILDTQTRTARWENTLSAGVHEFVLGAEYSNDSVAGSNTGFGPYAEEERDNKAIFSQALLDFSPVALQASLRFDDNEAYGDEVTGSLALGYELDGSHTIRASYGTAFVAPTFNDLYWPGYGFPDLEAETSDTLEVGVRGGYTSWFWDAAVYQTDIDNLISWQMGGRTKNIPTTRIRGVELAAGAVIDDWTLATALTYTDPENRETGDRLPRRATQSLRFDIDREMGDWSLGGSWIAQNHRYEYDYLTGEPMRLDGFGLLNLRAGWEFAPMWSARVTLENALDKEYTTAKFFDGDDYINAGRAAFLSVHFGP